MFYKSVTRHIPAPFGQKVTQTARRLRIGFAAERRGRFSRAVGRVAALPYDTLQTVGGQRSTEESANSAAGA